MGSVCNSILAHGPLTIGVRSSEESERNMVEEHETGEQNETCRTCEYMQHETHDFGSASMSMSAWCVDCGCAYKWGDEKEAVLLNAVAYDQSQTE